jgi:hypothetical protein
MYQRVECSLLDVRTRNTLQSVWLLHCLSDTLLLDLLFVFAGPFFAGPPMSTARE